MFFFLCSLFLVLPVCRGRRPQHIRLLRHVRHQPIGLQHRQPAGHLERTGLQPAWKRRPRRRQGGVTEHGEAFRQPGGRDATCLQAPPPAPGNRPPELVRQRHRHRQPFLLLWKLLLLHRQPGHHPRGGLRLCFQLASPLGSRPEPLYLPHGPWTWVPGTLVT